jgi:hypothetical protein
MVGDYRLPLPLVGQRGPRMQTMDREAATSRAPLAPGPLSLQGRRGGVETRPGWPNSRTVRVPSHHPVSRGHKARPGAPLRCRPAVGDVRTLSPSLIGVYFVVGERII